MKKIVAYWTMIIITVLILYEFIGRPLMTLAGIPIPPSILGEALPLITKYATYLGGIFSNL